MVTKDEALDFIEEEIANRRYLRIGRWQVIVGSNSDDLYFKDCKLNGYYRLGTTDQRVRLDAALYHNNNQMAPSFSKRPDDTLENSTHALQVVDTLEEHVDEEDDI